MRIGVFLALMAMCYCGGMAQCVVTDASAKGYLDRGVQMCESGIYDGAADMLGHALAMGVNAREGERARLDMALCCYAKGKGEAALAMLEGFVRDYPTSVLRDEALAVMGDIYFYDCDYASACEAYGRVYRKGLDAKRKCDVTYRMGYAMLRLKRGSVVNGVALTDDDVKEKRAEASELFAELDGSREYGEASKFYKAYMDYEENDYGYALEGFQSVKKDSELGYYAQYYMCQIQYMKGEYDEAIALGAALLKDDRDEYMKPETERVVGESYYRNDEDDKAKEHLTKYVESDAGDVMVTARYVLGVLCSRNGEYEKAVELLSGVVNEPNVIGQAAYFYLGKTYVEQGKASLAAMAFEKAAKMDYSKDIQEEAYYNYAVSLIGGGHTPFGNAVGVMETFLKTFPKSGYADVVSEYLVAVYMNSNDYEKALWSIERIEQPNADVQRAKQTVLYNLGVKALSGNDVEGAEKYLLQARALAKCDKKMDAQNSLWLGECAYRKGDYEKAAKYQNEYVKGAAAGDANLGLGYYNYGYSRFQQGKYADARKAFEKALETNKLTKIMANDANNRVGDTYYYAGNFKTAQKYYDNSTGDYALYQKAMMLGYSRAYADKATQMETLVKKYPSSSLIPSALYEEADALQMAGNAKKAIKVYDTLVAKYPETEYARKALLNKAITEMNSKNEASAIEVYKEVVRRYATSEEAGIAIEDLKQIYASRGELQVLRDFLATVNNAPTLDVDEVDRLAFEAAEKNYIENANNVAMLEKYVAEYADGAFVAKAKYYLINYYYKNGKKKEALKLIEEFEAVNSDKKLGEEVAVKKVEILLGEGRHSEAIEVYKKLETMATTTEARVKAQMGVLTTARKVGDYGEVEVYANKLESAGVLSGEQENEVLYCKAEALQKQKRIAEAQEYYERLSQNVQSEYGAQAAYSLAEIHYNNNDYVSAENVINDFVGAGTPHAYWLARAFILLADVYYKQGSVFEAREYLESVKQSYPGKEEDIFKMIDTRLKKWKTQ